MIPPLFAKRLNPRGIRRVCQDIPLQFTLGKGHMLFWMDKGRYLDTRYSQLTDEMLRRGFKPNLTFEYGLSEEASSVSVDWTPKQVDIDTICERIVSRVSEKPKWYKYKGKPIIFEEYKDRLIMESKLDRV